MFFFNQKNSRSILALVLSMTSLHTMTAPNIGEIIDCFAGKNKNHEIKPFLGPVRLIEVTEDERIYSYYGIHVDEQTSVNFALFKHMVSTKMGHTDKPIMQIVGDSGRFSPEGTTFGRKFVRERLPGDFAIEYGCTGYKTKGQELDANSFINEFIDEQPQQASRVLANILGHTVWAINKWGCYVSPHVTNFVVVYNDAGMSEDPQFDLHGKKIAGFTTFGDDVHMSDFACDRLLCLEGGAQSFLQAINVLHQGKTIEAVYNIRKPADEKMFSAARFLQKVDAKFVQGKAPAKEVVETLFTEYISTLNSMFNESKPDFKTKKALFDRAMAAFIDGGLFERVHEHCTFYNAAQ